MSSPPTLTGQHFRVTVVEEPGFVDFDRSHENKIPGGYCIDIFRTIATRANFTYEFLPPSGFGSACHQLADDATISTAISKNTNNDNYSNNSNTNTTSKIIPYGETYRSQYLCGQSDVNDLPNGKATNATLMQEYATDIYLGMFYVTPERQLQNLFTQSFHPPTTGALTLFGTAIRISSVEDLIMQQKQNLQPSVCVQVNTAFGDYIRSSLPDLKTKPYDPVTMGDYYTAFANGDCEIQMTDNPIATRFILEQKRKEQCKFEGKPIGIITDPLTYGFSQYAIGVRKDMPRNVVDTLDYWMNYFMTCSPNDASCDSFSQLYPQSGGTGDECQYVAFPPAEQVPVEERLLSQGAIAGLAVGLMGMLAFGLFLWHSYKLRKQRHRYKKRFVQQIARNIQIGPSPRDIPAEKLAEEIQHISSSRNGIIQKEDLRKWMFDIKLNFLSDRDFEALWSAIDLDGRGVVEPLEFFVFMSVCGPEFEKVHKEISNMTKTERLKWASRRLTNYKLRGEAGVRKMEHDLERRTRQNMAYQNHGRNAFLGNAMATSNGANMDDSSQGSSTVSEMQQRSRSSQLRSPTKGNNRKNKFLPGIPYGPPIDESTSPSEFFTTYNRSPDQTPRTSISSLRSTMAPLHYHGDPPVAASASPTSGGRSSDASSTMASFSMVEFQAWPPIPIIKEDVGYHLPSDEDNNNKNKSNNRNHSDGDSASGRAIEAGIDDEDGVTPNSPTNPQNGEQSNPEVNRASMMSAMSEMTYDV